MLLVLAYVLVRSYIIIALFRVMLQGPYFSVNYIIMTTVIHSKNCIYFQSLQYMFQGSANIRLSAVNVPLCCLREWIFVTTIHATSYLCEPLTVRCNLNYGKNYETSLCSTKSYTIIPYPRRKRESIVWRQRASIHIYIHTHTQTHTHTHTHIYIYIYIYIYI